MRFLIRESRHIRNEDPLIRLLQPTSPVPVTHMIPQGTGTSTNVLRHLIPTLLAGHAPEVLDGSPARIAFSFWRDVADSLERRVTGSPQNMPSHIRSPESRSTLFSTPISLWNATVDFSVAEGAADVGEVLLPHVLGEIRKVDGLVALSGRLCHPGAYDPEACGVVGGFLVTQEVDCNTGWKIELGGDWGDLDERRFLILVALEVTRMRVGGRRESEPDHGYFGLGHALERDSEFVRVRDLGRGLGRIDGHG